MSISLQLNGDFCLRLTLTLLHFLWQGVAIALLALVLSGLLRRASAALRYWMLVALLGVMALCPMITFILISPAPGAPDPIHFQMTSPATISEVSVQSIAASQNAPAASPTIPSPQPTAPTIAQPGHNIFLSLFSSDTCRRAAPYISIAYLAGLLLMFARLVMALRGGVDLRRNSKPLEDAKYLATLRHAAVAIRLRALPAIAWCEQMAVPTVVGILKPTILLPLSLSSGLTPDQIEMLLLHELAHLRRHDPWINLAQWVIETTLFFHPAVWWISHRIRAEREIACDDMVIRAGIAEAHYADSLLRMAEISRRTVDPERISVLALGSHGQRFTGFGQRILRLIEPRDTLESIRPARVWPVAIALVLVLAGCAAMGLVGQENKAKLNAKYEMTIEVDRIDQTASNGHRFLLADSKDILLTLQADHVSTTSLKNNKIQIRAKGSNSYPLKVGVLITGGEEANTARFNRIHEIASKNPDAQTVYIVQKGWDKELVEIPTAIVLPQSLLETKAWKKWKRFGNIQTLQHVDEFGRRYVVQALGWARNRNKERFPIIPRLERYRPDGSLEAYSVYNAVQPSECYFYAPDGKTTIATLWIDNYPSVRDFTWRDSNSQDHQYACTDNGIIRFDWAGKMNDKGLFSIEKLLKGRNNLDKAVFQFNPEKSLNEIQQPIKMVSLPLLKDEQSKSSADSTSNVAVFSNGAQSELLGVAEHPRRGNECWGIDGRLLSKVPEGFKESKGGSWAADRMMREFYLRFSNMPQTGDPSVEFQFGGDQLASTSSSLEKLPNSVIRLKVGGAFPKGMEKTSIRLGIATGPWEGVAETSGGSSTGTNVDGKPVGLAFSDAFREGASIRMIVSSDYNLEKDWNIRFVAIDASGQIFVADRTEHVGAGSMLQSTYVINNDQSDSKFIRYELQKRNYEWQEIKDIPLKPEREKPETSESLGKVSSSTPDMQTVAQNRQSSETVTTSSPSVSFSNNIQAHFVGISEHRDRSKIWAMDGKSVSSLPTIFKTPADPNNPQQGEAPQITRDFYIAIDHLPKDPDIEVVCKIVSGGHSAGGAQTKAPLIAVGVAASLLKEIKWTDIQLGIASGPWKTLASVPYKGTYAEFTYNNKDCSVYFGRPSRSGDYLYVSVSDNCLGPQHQVIAIDQKGKQHESHINQYSDTTGMRQCDLEFKTIPSNVTIDHYEFQVREYEWREFKNVALYPFNASLKVPSDSSDEVTHLTDDTSSTRSESNVLSFPKDRSAGELFPIDRWTTLFEYYKPSQVGIEARGTVQIPPPLVEEVAYGLKLGPESMKDLSFLIHSPQYNLKALIFPEMVTQSDDQLRYIVGLRSVRWIGASHYKMGDLGAQYLGQMPWLEQILLEYSAITDEGLRQIGKIKNLKALGLWDVQGITSKGMQYLSQLSSLEYLDLTGDAINDSGLIPLADLPSLKVLRLTATKVTGKGVLQLQKMKKLERLELAQLPISDADLPQLVQLSHLKELNLVETKVTKNGVEKIKSQLPNCNIIEDTEERETSDHALGMNRNPRSAEALAASLKDDQINVRNEALRAMVLIGAPSVPYLITAMKEANPLAREMGAMGLNEIQTITLPMEMQDSVADALIAGLQDEATKVRYHSAIALGNKHAAQSEAKNTPPVLGMPF